MFLHWVNPLPHASATAIRPVLFVLAPALGFGLLTQLSASAVLPWPLLNYELIISRVDRLSLAFGYVFTLAALLGAIYGFHLRDLGQQVAALLYVGAGLGVVFAGGWLTLYVFWEIMAMASVWLILSARAGLSTRAALRYLLMHLFGGAVLFWRGYFGTSRTPGRFPSSLCR